MCPSHLTRVPHCLADLRKDCPWYQTPSALPSVRTWPWEDSDQRLKDDILMFVSWMFTCHTCYTPWITNIDFFASEKFDQSAKGKEWIAQLVVQVIS